MQGVWGGCAHQTNIEGVLGERSPTQLKSEPLQLDGILLVLNPCHMARCGAVVGMCFTPRLQQAAPGKHDARVAAGFAANADLTWRLATKGAFDCRLG